MGTVFLAEQIGVGDRPVALKVLLRKLLDDPEFLMRFCTEAAATGKIHHSNVVTIYESGQTDDGTPYIAMEYLDGDTLREVLKNCGALPLEETVEIVQQVARGLNAAHKQGIIHRDLKPDNIFLTRSDEGELLVKVVVMRALRKERDKRHTAAPDFARELREAAEIVKTASTRIVAPVKALSESAPPLPRAGEDKAQKYVRSGPLVRTYDHLEPLQEDARVVGLPRAARRSRPISQDITSRLTFQSSHASRKAVWILLVAVAIGAIGVGGWYWWKNQSSASVQHTGSSQGITGGKTTIPEGMVAIPGGTFMMARNGALDPEGTPAHSATVSPFFLDKTTYIKGDSFDRVAGRALPLTNITWFEAQAYCEGEGKRLPTEEEWEFAARGTDGRLYPWGNEFKPNLANSLEQGLRKPEWVGFRPSNASPFGALDMSGNVWQYTADDYRPYPGHQPTFKIPPGAKVIRGGSLESDKVHVTATTRGMEVITTRSPGIGFRCARSQ